MKKLSVVLLLFFTAVTIGAAQPADTVTSRCMLYLQINNPEQLLSRVESYLIAAGAPLQAGQLKMMLSSKIFGMPGFGGVNIRGKLGVALYSRNGAFDMSNKPGVLLVLPVGNRQQMTRQIGMLATRTGGALRFKNGYAYLTPTPWAYNEAQNGNKKSVRFFAGSHVQLYMNMGAFQKLMTKQMSRSMQMLGGANPVAKAFMDVYNRMLQGYRNMVLSGTFQPGGIEGGMRFSFASGSAAARLMSGTGSSLPQSVKFLSPDSYLAAASRANVSEYAKLYQPLLNAVRQIAPVSGKQLLDLLEPVLKNYRKEVSFGMWKQKQGLGFQVICKVDDPALTRAAYSGIARLFNNHRKIQQSPVRFVYNSSSAVYRKVKISSARFTIKDNSTLDRGDGERLQIIFDQLQLFTAWINGYELHATGPEGLAELKRMIDRVKGNKKGFDGSAAWKRLQRRYGQEKKNGIFYFDLSALLNTVFQLGGKLDPDNAEIRTLRLMFSGVSASMQGFYGYSYGNGRQMVMKMFLPREDLMQLFKLMQTIGMKQQAPSKYR